MKKRLCFTLLFTAGVLGSGMSGMGCASNDSAADASEGAIRNGRPLPPGVTPVTDEDEAFHDMRQAGPMGYEWWYFDAMTEGGDQLALSYQGPNTFDFDLATLTNPDGIRKHLGMSIQLHTKEGKTLEVLD